MANDARTRSRHGRAGTNEKRDDNAGRASARLEEPCAIFLRPEDLDGLMRMVDLADRWNHLHAAYGGETRLPFSLHDLRLLKGASLAGRTGEPSGRHAGS